MTNDDGGCEMGNTDVPAITTEAEGLRDTCLWAAECHYAAETRWFRLNYFLGIPATVLAAIAGAAGFSQLTDLGTSVKEVIPIVAATVSLLVAGLTALLTLLNPHVRASEHHKFAHAFELLFQDSEHVRLKSKGSGVDTLKQEIDDIRAQFKRLIESRPPIPGYAYANARRKILSGTGEVLAENHVPRAETDQN